MVVQTWRYQRLARAQGLHVGRTTPIRHMVVDGVMYFHSDAPVLALNPVTGKQTHLPLRPEVQGWALQFRHARCDGHTVAFSHHRPVG